MNSQIKFCSLSKGDIYTQLYLAAESGAYTSYLRGTRCKTEDIMFYEVSASFQFPYYFGENWDAMDECLCDLEWLLGKSASILSLTLDEIKEREEVIKQNGGSVIVNGSFNSVFGQTRKVFKESASKKDNCVVKK